MHLFIRIAISSFVEKDTRNNTPNSTIHMDFYNRYQLDGQTHFNEHPNGNFRQYSKIGADGFNFIPETKQESLYDINNSNLHVFYDALTNTSHQVGEPQEAICLMPCLIMQQGYLAIPGKFFPLKPSSIPDSCIKNDSVSNRIYDVNLDSKNNPEKSSDNPLFSGNFLTPNAEPDKTNISYKSEKYPNRISRKGKSKPITERRKSEFPNPLTNIEKVNEEEKFSDKSQTEINISGSSNTDKDILLEANKNYLKPKDHALIIKEKSFQTTIQEKNTIKSKTKKKKNFAEKKGNNYMNDDKGILIDEDDLYLTTLIRKNELLLQNQKEEEEKILEPFRFFFDHDEYEKIKIFAHIVLKENHRIVQFLFHEKNQSHLANSEYEKICHKEIQVFNELENLDKNIIHSFISGLNFFLEKYEKKLLELVLFKAYSVLFLLHRENLKLSLYIMAIIDYMFSSRGCFNSNASNPEEFNKEIIKDYSLEWLKSFVKKYILYFHKNNLKIVGSIEIFKILDHLGVNYSKNKMEIFFCLKAIDDFESLKNNKIL
ncbi:hypothetical protein H312_03209 [Anncaliia algerae PRA339]|uniref:Uncharacterized protein n=1 Tax=Anncaliia algerae PRA339 TaxID=1288291 RepID=A0A059EWZ9_9MICR|nr:hypothetical protein H312_03209 [Anncaliia algerae PRA339]